MKKHNRSFSFVKGIFLISMLCILFLSGCSQGTSKKLIKEAKKNIEGNAAPADVYIMEYSSLDSLSDEDYRAELLESTIRSIPTSGTCVLLGPPEGVYGFSGLHAVFFNQKGEQVFDFDYSKRYKEYEDTMPSVISFSTQSDLEKATRYLEECNWFAGTCNYAYDKKHELNGNLEKDQWYSE